jgi:GTPase SAR1 family protein
MSAVHAYLVGTAGSGKSTLAGAYGQWLTEHEYSGYHVNLDPGAETLPYEPGLDVRAELSLGDVMEEMGLGPNGAQVACADILAMRAGAMGRELEGLDTDVVLIDTPGQIELFAFRHSSRRVVDELSVDRAMLVFLFDPFLSQTANGFVSQLLLAATVEFRFGLPFLPVLSKADMLEEEVLQKVLSWSGDIDLLYDELTRDAATMDRQLGTGVFRTLEDMGAYRALVPVSSETGQGLEDVYTQMQNIFFAGDDLETR